MGTASVAPLAGGHLDPENAGAGVGPRAARETHNLFRRDVNWLGDGPLAEIPAGGMELYAKVRSTRPPRPAVLHSEDGTVWVELVDGESGVAPGQACVLYSDDGDAARVFGGGFIDRTERCAEAEEMLTRLSANAALRKSA